ncbi:peptide synthetase [Actinophytocola xinjiangensis]|uniref:Peptide synthetase n=1 Tax=Actinophytocola xinjiangensis TaxID=485602 RepID=A0A7Z0WMV9_9PSEU|nr:amino acid adenylation domain-containing protein [Actinophytocola xinjiangensis]OLF11175.1 peptide synthetase [Actinophytocola xinjiangensis]
MDDTDRSEPLLRHLSRRDRELFWLFGKGPRRTVSDPAIHHAIERMAATHPTVTAVEHHGEAITYRELDARATALACHLADLGVRPGDHVALFLRRSIPMVVGILATLKAGAAYVPQDVAIAPPAQLRHVLAIARPRVVLTTADHADHIPGGHPILTIPASGADQARPAFRPRRPARPDDPCYVLFTSGTTGMPNGVTVTHGNVVNLLLTQPGDLGIQPGWRVGQLLNIAFDMAAWEILGCLSHGATLVIRGEDIAATARDLDVIVATPTILSRLDPEGCPRVRVVAVAGEPCPGALADRWAGRAAFHNGCGPTEVTIVNTMGRHRVGEPVTIGRPTPNNTVYVLDEHGRPCPPGEPGEMWAGGDCVSAGYLDNPDLTGERYRPDPFLGGDRLMFRTRDLARWTPDGDLEHLGRTDDQVKIRGFRVELDSVSAVLETLPGCTRAVTLKLDSDHLVSFTAGAGVDPDEARWAVSRALPYYCVPAEVYSLDTLPQTPRGKIDKATLLDLARGAGAIA